MRQPINSDGSSVFKAGSTIPVKFTLANACGAPVTDAVARLYLAKISNEVTGDEIEAGTTSAGSTGNLFRYDADTGNYIFNLGTKDLEAGTWRLRIYLEGDGASHYVTLGLK